jgi:TPR repeat protein
VGSRDEPLLNPVFEMRRQAVVVAAGVEDTDGLCVEAELAPAGRVQACRQFHRDLIDVEWLVSPTDLAASFAKGAYSTVDLAPRANPFGTTEAVRSRCDNGDSMACLELGKRHYAGQDAPLDTHTAIALFRKTCSVRPANCDVLAHALTFDATPPSISAEAMKAFDLACNNENGQACMAISLAHDLPDSPKAARLQAVRLERACRAGFRESCFAGSVLYAVGRPGIPTDVERSRRYVRRGFDLLWRSLNNQLRDNATTLANVSSSHQQALGVPILCISSVVFGSPT